MRISPSNQGRAARENVIPMINVVFLLLVFFLITARIAPPLPIEIEAPEAEGAAFDASPDTMVISAAGAPFYMGQTGDAVWGALAARDEAGPLTLRVDRNLDGKALASVLAKLAEVSTAGAQLVVEN